jgi:hypothetical protein
LCISYINTRQKNEKVYISHVGKRLETKSLNLTTLHQDEYAYSQCYNSSSLR